MLIKVTNHLLRSELERIWKEPGVKSPTHYLVWTMGMGEPSWRPGRLATLRKSRPKRKVSRHSVKED